MYEHVFLSNRFLYILMQFSLNLEPLCSLLDFCFSIPRKIYARWFGLVSCLTFNDESSKCAKHLNLFKTLRPVCMYVLVLSRQICKTSDTLLLLLRNSTIFLQVNETMTWFKTVRLPFIFSIKTNRSPNVCVKSTVYFHMFSCFKRRIYFRSKFEEFIFVLMKNANLSE